MRPIWSALRAPEQRKHELHDGVSRQLEAAVHETTDSCDAREHVLHVEEQYALIEGCVAVWPVRPLVLQGVLASTVATWAGIEQSAVSMVR